METDHRVHHRKRWIALLDLLATTPDESSQVTPVIGTGSWHWLYADESGVAIAGPPVSFGSQPAAERWVQSNIAPLTSAGISAVTLLDGEHAVYGPVQLLIDGPAWDEVTSEL